MLPIKAILLLLVSYFCQFPFPPPVSEISFRATRRKIHVVSPPLRVVATYRFFEVALVARVDLSSYLLFYLLILLMDIT